MSSPVSRDPEFACRELKKFYQANLESGVEAYFQYEAHVPGNQPQIVNAALAKVDTFHCHHDVKLDKLRICVHASGTASKEGSAKDINSCFCAQFVQVRSDSISVQGEPFPKKTRGTEYEAYDFTLSKK